MNLNPKFQVQNQDFAFYPPRLHPVPKMDEVFFGNPLGSKMTWEPIRIDFSLLGVFRGQFERKMNIKLKIFKY